MTHVRKYEVVAIIEQFASDARSAAGSGQGAIAKKPYVRAVDRLHSECDIFFDSRQVLRWTYCADIWVYLRKRLDDLACIVRRAVIADDDFYIVYAAFPKRMTMGRKNISK
jgi:hypothetical protein